MTAEITNLRYELERKDSSLNSASESAQQEAIRFTELDNERQSLLETLNEFKA